MKNKYYIFLVILAIIIIIIGGYFFIKSRNHRIENNISSLEITTNNPEIIVSISKVEGEEYTQIYFDVAPVNLTDLTMGDYFVTASLNSLYACDYEGEIITLNPGQTEIISVDMFESEKCFDPGMNVM